MCSVCRAHWVRRVCWVHLARKAVVSYLTFTIITGHSLECLGCFWVYLGALLPALFPGASRLQGWKPPRWGELQPFPYPARVDALVDMGILKTSLLNIGERYFNIEVGNGLFGSNLQYEHMVLHMLASTIMWYPQTHMANETPLLCAQLRNILLASVPGCDPHQTLVIWSNVIKTDFTVC
jgi:hypothetical protein